MRKSESRSSPSARPGAQICLMCRWCSTLPMRCGFTNWWYFSKNTEASMCISFSQANVNLCEPYRSSTPTNILGMGPKGSVPHICTRSHRFRWRLFFMPFEKRKKHLPLLIDAFSAQKRRSVEIIRVAVAHPVKICVQPKFAEQRCLPLCFLLTS